VLVHCITLRWLVGWLIGWLVGWLVGWLAGTRSLRFFICFFIIIIMFCRVLLAVFQVLGGLGGGMNELGERLFWAVLHTLFNFFSTRIDRAVWFLVYVCFFFLFPFWVFFFLFFFSIRSGRDPTERSKGQASPNERTLTFQSYFRYGEGGRGGGGQARMRKAKKG